MSNINTQVKEVMDKYGIPQEIWRPIMLVESSGNPNARNITKTEHSIGLFQINIKANPQYSGLNLTDPRVNAEIAARDFILPAYTKAKGQYTSQKDIAIYTYKKGIKPYWTSDLEKKYLGLVEKETHAGLGREDVMRIPAGPELMKQEEIKLGFWDNLGSKILTGLFLLLLVALFFVSLLQLFPNIKEVI